MPQKETFERARKDKAEGKSASTQAGEFVREEMDDIREGKHGARSPEQAIAIGLSKARRAGVELPPPRKGSTSEATRERAKKDLEKAHSGTRTKASTKRSKATLDTLKREPRSSASKAALSKHAKRASKRK